MGRNASKSIQDAAEAKRKVPIRFRALSVARAR